MKNKILSSLIGILIGVALTNAQNRDTPSNLRVKVDVNGYLLVSTAAQTNPITTVTFNNARLNVDNNGNLVVVSSGGIAPANATYIVQTANATLTNAQAIGALSSGILR